MPGQLAALSGRIPSSASPSRSFSVSRSYRACRLIQNRSEVPKKRASRSAGQVEEKLRAATSWDERFMIAADVLGRRLGAGSSVDLEVACTWRRTVTRRGRVRVDGLADEVGWSRKRLWSRFRSQIGLTPKRAAELVRFDHAAHLLAAGHAAASVAAQSGYVDQSHLHREVKAIAGVTPTAVATAPWLAIDDVAWPAAPRT